MLRTVFFFLFTAVLTAACSNQPQHNKYTGHSSISAGQLTPYQQTIAVQLFEQHQGLQRVAVTSFVPTDSLQQGQDKYADLARQLQEGVLSEAHHFNVGLVEYRLATQVQLDQQQERALSREQQVLRSQYRFDYMVVGTYTEVDKGLLLNVRLVSSRSATVLSAASVMVPWSAIETRASSSQWRKDGLYREAASKEST